MRFMILIKADKHSEAGEMPDEKLLTDMGRFNTELVEAGVMQAGEGLHPSSKSVRVRFMATSSEVVRGPFPIQEVICGFWIWKLASMEEAIAWVKRVPNPLQGDYEIEIRPICEAEDFGDEFTPELRAEEERLRAKLEQSGS